MLSDFLLRIIVFLLPTQLGLHFWPTFSRLGGLKVDYLSPTLYLIDIFIFCYLLVNFRKLIITSKNKTLVLSYLALVLINTCFSSSPALTLLSWLKISLYLVFYFLLTTEKNLWKKTKLTFAISLVFVLLVQAIQFFKQSSLNGIFYWFGERDFTFSTPGVAKTYLFNRSFVRVPSVFSHPNSLAGFLAVSFIVLQKKSSNKLIKIMTILGMILTFSKSILFWLVSLPFLNKRVKHILFLFLLATISMFLLKPNPTYPDFILDRLYFLEVYKPVIQNKFIFGTGLGGYIVESSKSTIPSYFLQNKLQPVHNIFLLSLAELGLVGYLFVYKLILLYKLKMDNLYSLIALVLVTGLFDHYWLTLTQNKLILLFALAVIS